MSVHRPEELAFSHTFCSLQLGMDSNTTTSDGLTMASSSPERLDLGWEPQGGTLPVCIYRQVLLPPCSERKREQYIFLRIS